MSFVLNKSIASLQQHRHIGILTRTSRLGTVSFGFMGLQKGAYFWSVWMQAYPVDVRQHSGVTLNSCHFGHAEQLSTTEVDIQTLADLVKSAREPASKRRGIQRLSSRREPNAFGEWQCSHCKTFKGTEQFYDIAGGGLSSHCRECNRERLNAYYRTLRGLVQTLVRGARSRSLARGLRPTLVLDHVLDMLLEQRGCCFYSGVPLELTLPNSHWRVSLERLDNIRGYTKENCVLIAAEFNTSDYSRPPVRVGEVSGTAQWSKEKVQAVPRRREVKVDLGALARQIQDAKARPTSTRRGPKQSRQANASGEWFCRRCQQDLPANSFHANSQVSCGLALYCKECHRQMNAAYHRTLRGMRKYS